MNAFYVAIALRGDLPPEGEYRSMMARLMQSDGGRLCHVRRADRAAIVQTSPFPSRRSDGSQPDSDVVVAGSTHLTHRERFSPRWRHLSDLEFVRGKYAPDGSTRWLDSVHGDFAIAVLDPVTETVTAAVDRFGVERLYWAFDGRLLHFSNKVLALLSAPGVSAELSAEVIGMFLLSGSTYNYSPGRTSFAAVHRLEPGHELTARRGGEVRVRRYWAPPVDVPMLKLRDPREYGEALRSVLAEAVRDRISVAQRPLVTLSGGRDSASILALATNLRDAGALNGQLSAQTMGYRELVDDPDVPLAADAAAHFGVPHAVRFLDRYGPTNPLPVWVEPSVDIRSGLREDADRWLEEANVDLVLTGSGSDELFLPIPLHEMFLDVGPARALAIYAALWRNSRSRPRFNWQKYLRQFGGGPERTRAVLAAGPPEWIEPSFAQGVSLGERWRQVREWWSGPPAWAHPLHPETLRSVMWPDWHFYPETVQRPFARQVRRTSPFLDIRVLELALSLPPWPFLGHKAHLRQAMSGLVPQAVLDRRKIPGPDFTMPLVAQPQAAWLDDPWEAHPALDEYVSREKVPKIRAQVDQGGVRRSLRPLQLNTWLRAMDEFRR